MSGGALSGRIVFTLEDIQRFRQEEPETPLILVRSDTVPEDIQEISLTEGLLTAKGGQTSHAAIVAFELDKTAVVGCHNLLVLESEGTLPGQPDRRCRRAITSAWTAEKAWSIWENTRSKTEEEPYHGLM